MKFVFSVSRHTELSELACSSVVRFVYKKKFKMVAWILTQMDSLFGCYDIKYSLGSMQNLQ